MSLEPSSSEAAVAGAPSPVRRAVVPPAVLLVATALLCLGAAAVVPKEAPPRDPPAARAVLAVALTVSDLDRSLAFFTGVLGFENAGEDLLEGDAVERAVGVFGARIRRARLRLGGEALELIDFLAPEGEAFPADTKSHDRWFQHVAIVVSDMERAYRHLRDHGVRHASTGPQRLPEWNPDAGGIEAFYFRDQDGHFLEVIRFPPGKGDPRWQEKDRLFLGIDHTAIVVEDTERSLAFYQGALGLAPAGASENHGPEQERLNNVFGARLRITALRAAAGPGVELLEYLAPSTGRPFPRTALANDLLHWHVVLDAPAPAEAALAARKAGGAWISPGAVPSLPPALGAEAALVRDPDGHALLFLRTP